jgi:hypothetical protein
MRNQKETKQNGAKIAKNIKKQGQTVMNLHGKMNWGGHLVS